jgi:undecaprenol kinase
MKNAPFRTRLFNAYAGIIHALKHEQSFKLQLIAAIVAFAVLIFFKAGPIWWSIFGIASSSVLAAELFNTALENILDRIHPGTDPLIRIAKDCAAGAVLILSGGALIAFLSFFITQWGSH